ncbi:MAG: hypothetical protein Ct9H90mP6_07310 [Gammaproteobacteria bacterium]|nr:MAG: hypothetical protein Ct9H90mP6_07310 [Gammaproteobacteria bacterium]
MNDHPLKVEHHNTTSDGGSIASKDYEDRYFQDNGFDESKEVTLMVITSKRGGKVSQGVVLLLVSWVLV